MISFKTYFTQEAFSKFIRVWYVTLKLKEMSHIQIWRDDEQHVEDIIFYIPNAQTDFNDQTPLRLL